MPLLFAKFALLLAGLVGPGAAIARALRLPAGPSTCFAGSAITLFAAILGLNLAGISITLGSLVTVVSTITLAAVVLARRQRAPALESNAGSASGSWIPRQALGTWTPLYLLFVAVIVLRACREPLAGVDHEFRWSFLSEQILRHGSLAFYPPLNADDFRNYFWAESIPPGVSALYAWCYACIGSAAHWATVPVVLLQFWSLHELSWRIGGALGGERAARFAMLGVASCALLTWSLLLAQESGFLTLALLGIVAALLQWQRTPHPRWAASAALFAVLGASAREYGAIAIVMTGLGLFALRADRRSWLAFIAIVLPLAAWWPLRILVLTGNPFYSLPVGPLPTNPRFVGIVELSAATFGQPVQSVAGWLTLGRYLVTYAPVALLGGGILLWAALSGRKPQALLLAAAAVFAVLWLASVRYTTGGLFYSLRVAAPAIAVAGIAAGVWLASLSTARIANAALGLLAAVSLPGTLALPQNPWRTPWRDWPTWAGNSAASTSPAPDPAVGLVLADGHPGVVLTDSAGHQSRFAAMGRVAIPPWSPQANWLFDASLSPANAVEQWRASGVRYVVIGSLPGNRAAFDYLRAHAAWMRSPFRWRFVGETPVSVVYALDVEP
jgi:hypothetical protein